MRGTRAKKIRKLVNAMDFGLLMSVRRIHGQKSSQMTEVEIYKAAKKIYKKRRELTENWGKIK